MRGTPLGDACALALERVAGCAHVTGSAPSGAAIALLDALSCTEAPALLAPLAQHLGDAQLALASGSGGDWSLLLGHVDESGGLVAEVVLPDELSGIATLLAPDAASPGASLFATDAALVHARLRVRDGIDLEQLKVEGTKAEMMTLPDFSGVLGGSLLDGTWELAVYAPDDGRTIPGLAIALGVRSTRAATAGMNALLGDLERTWQLQPRSSFSVGTNEGACLLDLTVLPDLAPCWVLAGDAIVVGWNQQSLFRALSTVTRSDDTQQSRLHVDFASMARVDEQMSKAAFPKAAPANMDYPWRALDLVAEGEGRLQLALPAAPGTP